MEDYFKDIKKRLEKKINFEKLEIINNSHKHKGHKFFSEERFCRLEEKEVLLQSCIFCSECSILNVLFWFPVVVLPYAVVEIV